MSALVVTRIGPGASVQDEGRPGHMHEGVPPGGALAPELMRLANAALGNQPGDPVIELPMHGATFLAEHPLFVSVDGEIHPLEEGATLTVPASTWAVRYLALPGGIDAPLLLGGRGALPGAGLGSYLKKGDRLCARAESPRLTTPLSFEADDAPFTLTAGPDDLGEEALAQLFAATFTVSRLTDRTGMRLEGPKLTVPPRDRPYSTPMVRGALQVTTDGSVIVLGPDHPTTGGYPVIAVLHADQTGRLALLRPGAPVSFLAAPPRTSPSR